MEETKKIRIGTCKHNNILILQYKDNESNDAPDEKGWLCLHRETREEEIKEIINYKTTK